MNTLLQQLHLAFNNGIAGKENKVRELLSSYVNEGNTDWQFYRMFSPYKYCRNLVDICPIFEVIVICWGENQESPIHNHTVLH